MAIHNGFNDSEQYTRMRFMSTGLSTCDMMIVTTAGIWEYVSLIWDLSPDFYLRKDIQSPYEEDVSERLIPAPNWTLYDRQFKGDVTLDMFREDYLLFQELKPAFLQNLRDRHPAHFFEDAAPLEAVPASPLFPHSSRYSQVVSPDQITGEVIIRMARHPHLLRPETALERLLNPKARAHENFGDFLSRYL